MLSIKDAFYHDLIECLVTALEVRDSYSAGHSQRVADMACDLAKRAGLQAKKLEMVHIAAHLHDIGKIGVPDAILSKSGKLSLHELLQIQKHPELGYHILAKSPYLQPLAKMILHHHERWDGNGYPSGLKRKEIPFGARIIAVCDTIDAITSDRPYRKAFSWSECLGILFDSKGTQHDPLLVDTVATLWDGWQQLREADKKKKTLHTPRYHKFPL